MWHQKADLNAITIVTRLSIDLIVILDDSLASWEVLGLNFVLHGGTSITLPFMNFKRATVNYFN